MGVQQTTSRIAAIDALKAIAIICVLLYHAVPEQVLNDSFAVFHIWQGVPILLVLMGYTGVLARVKPLRSYLTRRARRLLIPLAFIWLASATIAVSKGEFAWDPLLLLGLLPASGPGNYFILFAVAFALVLPLLRRILDANPIAFIAICLAVSVTHELLAPYLDYEAYLRSASLARVLFCVGLGMLLASGHRASRWIPVLLLVSVPYLVAMGLGYRLPFMVESWQSQSFFASAYPAVLVILGLRLRYPRWLAGLGRASYHIFLLQILWFGQVAPHVTGRLPVHTAVRVLLDVVICLAAGVLFAQAGKRLFGEQVGSHAMCAQPSGSINPDDPNG